MSILAYDAQTKKITSSSAIDTVDKILDMKKDKNPWEVIDYLVTLWYDTSPEDAQGTMISVRDLKETRKDQQFGQTDDKNMSRRLIMIFPTELQRLIRKVYSTTEMPFDKQFFLDFANRYKAFQIPEQL
jgi:hypothetical protein